MPDASSGKPVISIREFPHYAGKKSYKKAFGGSSVGSLTTHLARLQLNRAKRTEAPCLASGGRSTHAVRFCPPRPNDAAWVSVRAVTTRRSTTALGGGSEAPGCVFFCEQNPDRWKFSKFACAGRSVLRAATGGAPIRRSPMAAASVADNTQPAWRPTKPKMANRVRQDWTGPHRPVPAVARRGRSAVARADWELLQNGRTRFD